MAVGWLIVIVAAGGIDDQEVEVEVEREVVPPGDELASTDAP